jgi:hypothetical protein
MTYCALSWAWVTRKSSGCETAAPSELPYDCSAVTFLVRQHGCETRCGAAIFQEGLICWMQCYKQTMWQAHQGGPVAEKNISKQCRHLDVEAIQ